MSDVSSWLARYGPWALITGGSEGLGAEFARQVAGRGLDVVIVARRGDVLARFCAELRERFSVDVRTIQLDLSQPGAVAALSDQVRELDVGLLVCSAALSPLGDFLQLPAEDHARLVELNCRVPALLSWEFGRRMVARGRGGIILLSSMASFQGTGFVAHYAASKAYLRVLAEGLWNELHDKGVDVLASCPGLVRTPTLLDGQPVRASRLAPPVMDCAPVVRHTLAALGRRPVVVPGTVNAMVSWITQHLLPRRFAITLTSNGTRSLYPHLQRHRRVT